MDLIRLIYVNNARLPTEKANGVQIAKMAEAFTKAGALVTLVIPKRHQSDPELAGQDLFKYYQIRTKFVIKKVANLDVLDKRFIGFHRSYLAYLIQNFTFAYQAFRATQSLRGLMYSRSKLFSLLVGQFSQKPAVFEAHDIGKNNFIDRWLARKTLVVVCITKSIQQAWKKLGAQTIYAPDAVSEEFFTSISQQDARLGLKLPQLIKLVVYTGSFQPWKGVNTIIQAAKKLKNIDFYLVGGGKNDPALSNIQKQTRFNPNIHIVPHQPYQTIPLWLKAADVLVIPNSAKFSSSAVHTSPLKLFEYMASATPILASSVPAIKEVLTTKEATFFKPDSATNLCRQLDLVFKNYNNSQTKAHLASQKAKQLTWLHRAEKILEQIKDVYL